MKKEQLNNYIKCYEVKGPCYMGYSQCEGNSCMHCYPGHYDVMEFDKTEVTDICLKTKKANE